MIAEIMASNKAFAGLTHPESSLLAGIAGSATLGDFVVVAGQAGIVGHIHIGDGAQVGGGSGVNFNVKPGEKVIGYPAMDVRSWMKMNMKLKAMVRKKDDKRGQDD